MKKGCKECNNYYNGFALNDDLCKTCENIVIAKYCLSCEVNACVNCNVYKGNKLYILLIKNYESKRWELVTGFYNLLKDCETVKNSMFTSMQLVKLGAKPELKIFYTLDVYSKDVKLFSVDGEDEVIIKDGLFK